MGIMRDNDWLEGELEGLLRGPFADVEIVNPILIKFGRKARTRFGSIRLLPSGESSIQINGVFRDHKVPAEVVQATIAHELAHYAHGFSSGHEQAHDHPHQGGVVDRELRSRGLGKLVTFQKRWAKETWPQVAPKPRASSRRRRIRYRWI
jgi:hypothetical protein